MGTADHEKVAAILRSALGLRPEGRRELLDRACGDDAELRRAVESMLMKQSLATMPGIESDAPGNGKHTSPAAATVGVRTIGSYIVEDILGEGGMGVVYRATQANPRRTVALKVVRPTLLTPRMLRRFEHESQVLGRLQHPGIAQVYEAGTADTGAGVQPFFAMEYVRGTVLTAHCANAQLTTRQRLGLFIKVCEAVQHAHQHGVIHRDLKPGNILVDQTGQPKVLDFGIARVTDSDIHTATMQTDVGQLVGTLPYMSPEQIAADPTQLDTRSDVYSLGVILYELLAGKLPHNVVGKTIPEAARVIEHQRPAPLSSINRVFRGDLQTIAGKALEKDKQRRYQSTSDLAADLIRYLHDEPILARPPSATYQLGKFASRHRGLVAAFACVLVILTLGVVATGYQAVRATRAERSESARRIEAEQARAEAEQQRDSAKREAKKAEAVTAFLADTISSVDPAEKGRNVKLADLLDDAGKQLADNYSDKPDVAAALHAALARSYHGLALETEALSHVNAAIEMFTGTTGADSADTQSARLTLGRVLRRLSKFDEARAVFQPLLELSEKTLGPDADETRRALEGLAWTYADQGKFLEAIVAFRDLGDRAERYGGPDDRSTRSARRILGEIQLEAGDTAAAEKLLLEVLERTRRVAKPGDSELMAIQDSLQQLARNRGDFDAAIAFGRASLEGELAKYGPDHPNTLSRRTTFSRTLIQGGKLDEAVSQLRDVLATQRTKLGAERFDTLTTSAFLADALQTMGQTNEAKDLRRFVAEARVRLLGPDHPQSLVARTNLAYVLGDCHEYAEAESILLDLFERRERLFGAEHAEVALTLSMLGSSALLAGDAVKAEPYLRRALAIREKILPEGSGARGYTMTLLGEVLRLQKKFDEAAALTPTGAEWVLSDSRSPARNKREAIARAVSLYENCGDSERAATWRNRPLTNR